MIKVIKKLQKRFILVAMCAVFAVLTIIMGIINITNYVDVISESDRTLAMLIENGGDFPRTMTGKNGTGNIENAKRNANGSGGLDKDDLGPGNESIKPHLNGMSAEAPFETRYFTVIFNDSGEVSSSNTGSIAAITSDEALTYAKQIYESGHKKGFLNIYRYNTTKTDSGTMVLFLDCSRGMNVFHSFLKTSLFVSLVGIIGVFIIVMLLSKRAIKPIAESYEKQKHFITDASHELKTPLTVISANTEVLELTNGENEWTKSIHNQVSRLTELTNSLVSLARMDERESRLIMTDFSLSDAVSESVEPFKQVISQQGKTLDENIQKNLTYTGNEDSIRKLVGILMDNAIKYSDDMGKIAVFLKLGNKGVVLSIKNTVYHIEKGNHEELFERFFRGDASRNSETGGSGIGLSIARAIVVAHKGKITARSDDGHSLIINVTL